MTKTVIHHSADYDGIFCREIARHFLGYKDVNYIGWNFGDPKIPMPQGDVFILDLSPDCIENPALDPNGVIWIDHHKSSIEKYAGHHINGYRIDGVAACRLTWQWFKFNGEPTSTKQHFVGRIVDEPLAVRLAGEYDIWDKRDSRADTFQYGLRIENDGAIQTMLVDDVRTEETVNRGVSAQLYAQKVDADLVTHRSYRLGWEGLNFIVLNTGRFNSLTFAALDNPETGHDALLGYMFNGKCWTVSLYHAKHRTDLDLSLIAVKHGGGGHRGACGFTCNKLPFMP